MSRHRNIRSMNYTDEYDGYDDVYGHSVEDDYCMSPSDASFIYNRDNNPQRIGAFLNTQKDIAEEDEGEANDEGGVSKVDNLKLESCLEQIKSALGNTINRQQMVDTILSTNYNVEQAINILLDKQLKTVPEKPEKDSTSNQTKSFKRFNIPQLGLNKLNNLTKPPQNPTTLSQYTENHLKEQLIAKQNNFNSLSDLTKNHFRSLNINKPSFPLISLTKKNSEIKEITNKNSEIKEITNKINKINILNEKQTNNWNIDLSKALIKSNQKGNLELNKNTVGSEENNFVPEVDFIGARSINHTPLLDCNLDLKAIIHSENELIKKASKFGKIVCLKYKKTVPYNFSLRKETLKNSKQFNFSTPSPDDQIKQYLRRK